MGFQYTQDDLEQLIKDPIARWDAFVNTVFSNQAPEYYRKLNCTLTMGMVETACILRHLE